MSVVGLMKCLHGFLVYIFCSTFNKAIKRDSREQNVPFTSTGNLFHEKNLFMNLLILV